MDRDGAVSRIQQRIGFRSDLSTEIVTALQDAQDRLESLPDLPWFLKSAQTDLTTTADQETLAYPTDLLREDAETGGLWYFDSAADDDDKYTELAKVSLSHARWNWAGEGKPKAYHDDGQQFRIFPTPDDTYTIRVIYYKKDTVLSAGNTTNDWLTHAPDLLIGEAGFDIAADLRDRNAMAIFDQQRTRGAELLLRENTAREEANRSRVFGGEADA